MEKGKRIMSMSSTPASERVHISFFGCRNAGKSSLVNAVTGQSLSVVSDIKGTTTDPVIKTMELLPLGPVVITDTPGFDDSGELGEKRVKKTRQILNRTDIAVLVVDGAAGLNDTDHALLDLIVSKGLPYIIAYNKSDLCENNFTKTENSIAVSAEKGYNIHELKEMLGALNTGDGQKSPLEGLISAGDTVVLVTPIDSAAPKGRLILPQQMVLRDILDNDASAVVTKENTLGDALDRLTSPPKLVVTDSQAFKAVAVTVPDSVPLTSFSILMARRKGFLDSAVSAITAIDSLKDGDTVLIAEGCTHHRQCDDIGTVKIPRWLREHSGKDIKIDTCSGMDFPEELGGYSAVIHCGGCMLNEKEVLYRLKSAQDQGVPFTNYGTVIAHINGILERSLRVFKGQYK